MRPRASFSAVSDTEGSGGLTHLDAHGRASMVDIGDKAITTRIAVAQGRISMKPEVAVMIGQGKAPKGDVLATARIAGIMAAKRTAELIPLCHQIALSSVKILLTVGKTDVFIECVVKTTGKTGVEMEALTGVSVCALTIYDMCKALDRSMRIGDISLMQKSGGKSGDYTAA